MKKIWVYINDILFEFRGCFTRERAFAWFVTATVGFMLRTDHLGVTGIIRELCMNSDQSYLCLLHFFHSSAWKLEGIAKKWAEIAGGSGWACRRFGKPVLIGDGVSVGKEGRKMPSVKKIHQESENSGKPEYIWGHMFGGIALLAGGDAKMFALPVSLRIHDGNSTVREWAGSEYAGDSHVTRLAREAFKTAALLKESCFLVLDRYFLSAPALLALADEAKAVGVNLITVITKAKKACVAYEKPDPAGCAAPKRGPKPKEPKKYGKRVKVIDLFTDAADQFAAAQIMMYGKLADVRYLCADLLWGDGLWQELRFVLVSYAGTQSILACTDPQLEPEKIIALYSCRFKIEVLFKAFKHSVGGFGYHFWNHFVPKLNRRDPAQAADAKLKEAGSPPDEALAQKVRESVINTYNATECFVMLCCIATGLLQMSALNFAGEINASPIRWLRTYTSAVPSEESTSVALRNDFWRISRLCPELGIVRIIRQKIRPGPPSSEAAA